MDRNYKVEIGYASLMGVLATCLLITGCLTFANIGSFPCIVLPAGLMIVAGLYCIYFRRELPVIFAPEYKRSSVAKWILKSGRHSATEFLIMGLLSLAAGGAFLWVGISRIE